MTFFYYYGSIQLSKDALKVSRCKGMINKSMNSISWYIYSRFSSLSSGVTLSLSGVLLSFFYFSMAFFNLRIAFFSQSSNGIFNHLFCCLSSVFIPVPNFIGVLCLDCLGFLKVDKLLCIFPVLIGI